MKPVCRDFPRAAAAALDNGQLQAALAKTANGFPALRLKAVEKVPEFEAMRDAARDIRDHVLDNLGGYLATFEARVIEAGGFVHWCATPEEANRTVLEICQKAGAKTVTKGKSMIGEEMGVNAYLEARGIQPVETDLGEYIIQLRGETPSHIVAPAIHVSKEQVAADFRAHHDGLDPDRDLDDPAELLGEARAVLRDKFIHADVGITGANMLVAETGSTVIVTNEGNGDLTQILPPVHIVLASIEKIVPTLEDAAAILRVLARSTSGQEQAVYNSFSTGPKRPGDLDGPEAFHVVLLDNGRSELLQGPYREALRCIRCGACLGHCPVWASVGGHAYGWVYSGPIGAVLSPALLGVEETCHLPQASTFCGRCESVCPVRIPIPKLLRQFRTEQWDRSLIPSGLRSMMGIWAAIAQRPRLYHCVTALAAWFLRIWSKNGRITRLPGSSWTRGRDLPVPGEPTFQSQWQRGGGRRS